MYKVDKEKQGACIKMRRMFLMCYTCSENPPTTGKTPLFFRQKIIQKKDLIQNMVFT